MATARTSFIGNYLKIGKTNPTVGTQTGEFALVLERLVNESKPGENRTTLAIFRSQKDIDAFAKGLKDLCTTHGGLGLMVPPVPAAQPPAFNRTLLAYLKPVLPD